MMRLYLADKAAVLVGLLAALISYQLLRAHVAGTTSGSLIDPGCTLAAFGDRANCAAVLSSPYAYIPPRQEGRQGRMISMPAAFLGLVYYAVITVWFLGIGQPGHERRRLMYFPAAWIAFGLLASIYFTYIMVARLDAWCPWCAVTHVLNLILAICWIATWPRRKEAAPTISKCVSEDDSSSPQAGSIDRMGPSIRRIVMTFAMIITVIYTCYLSFGLLRLDRVLVENREYQAELERIRGDIAALFAIWQTGEKHETPINEAIPVRTSLPEGPWFDVVVFSDFECPACGRMSAFLDERVNPLFGGRLRIFYRHFPLHADCNAAIPRDVRSHPAACRAAKWAEAARLAGGNEAFWRAHDYLFAHQAELKRNEISITELAESVGVERTEFEQALASSSCDARIAEDVRLAQEWRVPGTPTLFAEGRMVPRLARTIERFWDALADHYWSAIARRPRPAETRWNASTQGTPDRPAGL